MPLELGVWRVDSGVKQLDAGGLDLESRFEDILHGNISMLSPNWMVIGRQVQTSHGKRLDLLCMDRDGNLVVIELKRDMTERDTIAQALDYGSWVMSLKGDEIVRIFDNCQRTYRSDQKPISINEAFCSRFSVKEMPEELNESHELVIVGSAFDPATERIVEYLAAVYGVRINGVFFRLFKDEGREYLSRVWLREPTQASAILEDPKAVSEWNGEYYTSFGHDAADRNWEDAIKYGFLSAGGGTWYTQTLRMLQPGDRIWVNVPGGVGYVGVGMVEAPSVKIDEFQVNAENGQKALLKELPLRGPDILKPSEDPERGEYAVKVTWLKTVPLAQAIKEKGFFGNQNTVARPVSPTWNYTVQRLKERFSIP